MPFVWSMFAVTLIAVAARLFAKTPIVNPTFTFSWDDCCILASLVRFRTRQMFLVLSHSLNWYVGSDNSRKYRYQYIFSSSGTGLAYDNLAIDLGFGQDIWMISPDQITQILCIFFFSEIMYAIVITMTKISVVLFYLRIFYEPSFRKACLAIFTITIIFGIWHILQIVFVSWPVSYNWTFWDGRHTGRVRKPPGYEAYLSFVEPHELTRGHVKIFSFVNGGINIALDLSLCVLPVTQFINMSWTLKTKISTSLIFLFSLISSVTVASCIRLETLTEFGDSRNPTFELKGVAIWSLIEIHLSVICACIPGIVSLWRRKAACLQRRGLTHHLRNQPRTGRPSPPHAMSRILSLITFTNRRKGQSVGDNKEAGLDDPEAVRRFTIA
ncbi:hypothetical protein CDEST_01558 [Colletotrichum destructivum]|uniref:Rhodopsin domain-containing protein n=1 Tax=Colletotrichum destructivum TaxID=34406 RepID=A0AAX4I015_9PEZI|nr:hypothetical protein CDEST_01558 [Colletotrichum destructivum]